MVFHCTFIRVLPKLGVLCRRELTAPSLVWPPLERNQIVATASRSVAMLGLGGLFSTQSEGGVWLPYPIG
jgi:hypothetical protein